MKRPWWVSVLRYIALAAILLWSGFPILLMMMASLKPDREIFKFPPDFIFRPTLANYIELFTSRPAFFDALLNSIIITLGATLLTVVSSILAGYVYSRYRNTALAGSAFFMIVIRMLPPIIITLPLFPLVNALGLQDTHLVLIVLYATFFVSLNTWIMKAFIDQVPRELDEAAIVDGANTVKVLRYVIVPLSLQGIIATATFVFVFSWNEFLFAFIFTTSNAKTAPLVISEMLSSLAGIDWGVLFAATTLQFVPIMVLVVILQRFVVAGLTAGSVKG